MAHTIQRGRGLGQWWPLDLGDGKKSAELYCRTCGLPTTMVNHTIAADGTVTPSFVEHKDKERCGTTHENFILEGWVP